MDAHAGGNRPEAADAPYALERLTTFVHELANLLDGSLRCLGSARRALHGLLVLHAELEPVHRHVETVYGALERMAELINTAMRGSSPVAGLASPRSTQAITLGEAIAHAVDVLDPAAREERTTMVIDLTEEVGALPVGPLYPVVLNGLRNALESIARSRVRHPQRGPGRVQIVGRLRPMINPTRRVDLVELEIRDNGAGLTSETEPQRAFQFGYSTKPGGLGVGLALAQDVVAALGGTIELAPGSGPDPAGPGAVLRIVYPVHRPAGRS